MDRRTVDQDGRMRIPNCKISKANVCEYYGAEIPGWQSLGLDARRVYKMYRDPKALEVAAKTFEAVPLTVDHFMVSAEDFPAERVGGTVSNIRFEAPYLVGDVTAWTQDAIDGIVSDERRQLSCAYRYVASMITGTSPDGVRYDGIMTGPIRANHVALVKQGRAGPDVLVADGVPRIMTLKTNSPKILAALAALTAVIPESAKTELAAVDEAIAEEMAPLPVADEFPELSAEDKTLAADNARKTLGRDALTATEERGAYLNALKDRAAQAAPAAMDEATVQAAVDTAVLKAREGYVTQDAAAQLAADARTEVHALYTARAAVAERVGECVLDTAEAVYRFALDHAKVPHKTVPASALAALYAGVSAIPVVQDSAPAANAADVREMFSVGATRRS